MPITKTTQTLFAEHLATSPLPEITVKSMIEAKTHMKVEAWSDSGWHMASSNTGMHSFLSAAYSAFNDHRPLVLSPDMFWLVIAQGLAAHVNENAEEMRHRFVSHTGQELIEVRRDGFVKDSPENDWEGAFDEFSAKIKEFIGVENHNNIVVPFSTTGHVENVANEIVLMDAMKSYFAYRMKTMCGIPSITLEGEPADWADLADAAQKLGEAYELQWWTDNLVPVLQRLAVNAAGHDDKELWENFFKIGGGSGGPYVTGWITKLFPYVNRGRQLVKNFTLDEDMSHMHTFGGHGTDSFPSGLSQVNFKWLYYEESFDMQFIAGFVGVDQDQETLALRPIIGWGVAEKQEVNEEPDWE